MSPKKDIDQEPLTLETIKPGIWILVYNDHLKEPEYIGITMDNFWDKHEKNQTLVGHRIMHGQLLGSSPHMHVLGLGDTGLDLATQDTWMRTYHLPMETRFSDYANFRVTHPSTI